MGQIFSNPFLHEGIILKIHQFFFYFLSLFLIRSYQYNIQNIMLFFRPKNMCKQEQTIQNKGDPKLFYINSRRFRNTMTVKEIFQNYRNRRKSNPLPNIYQKDQKDDKQSFNSLFKIRINDRTIRIYQVNIEQLKNQSSNENNCSEPCNQVVLKQNKKSINIKVLPKVNGENNQKYQRKYSISYNKEQNFRYVDINSYLKTRSTAQEKEFKNGIKKNIKENSNENFNKIPRKNIKQSHNTFKNKKSGLLLTLTKKA